MIKLLELKKSNWILLGAIGFCLAASIFPSLNTIGLWVVAPFVIVVSLFRKPALLFSKNVIKEYVVMWLWVGVSVLTAEFSREAAGNRFVSITATMLLSFSVLSLCDKWSNIKLLYIFYILYFFELLFFVYSRIGLQFDFESSSRGGGQDVGMNSNNYAYYLFFATICVIVLLERIKVNTFGVIIAVAALLFFVVFTALFTSSRQVLIIEVPLIAVWLYTKMERKRFGGVFIFILIVSFLLFLVPIIYERYMVNSYLMTRSELNVGEDVRTELIKSAFITGLNHPLFGVGPSNYIYHNKYGAFSHCSYTEMFACSGLVPAILFIIIIVNFIKNSIFRYRKTGMRVFLVLSISGCFYAIYNFFYVFYIEPWLMMFLFLMIGHSDYEYTKYLTDYNKNIQR